MGARRASRDLLHRRRRERRRPHPRGGVGGGAARGDEAALSGRPARIDRDGAGKAFDSSLPPDPLLHCPLVALRQDSREARRLQHEERERAALAAERRKKLRGYAVAAVLGLAAVAAVLVAALGGADDGDAGQPAAEAGGGGHVHGLGVNPADGALYVAAHNGLFRAAPGEAQARLVGTSGKDVMGFSIVGPNRFLGSGHPGEGEDLPPKLGLILSTDAGRTFRPVSLLGEADFHVLRVSGSRVYGFDSSNGRFLASRD